MTFNELKKRFNFPLYPHEWHQHSNGGGWVQNTAHVDDTAFVGPEAIVNNTAQVLDHVKIEDKAIITENACVHGNAVIKGEACIEGYTFISGNAEISGKSNIYAYSTVKGGAKISGNSIVGGHCVVDGKAEISEDVHLMQECKIFGQAKLSGKIYVRGNLNLMQGDWKDEVPLQITSHKYLMSIIAPGLIYLSDWNDKYDIETTKAWDTFSHNNYSDIINKFNFTAREWWEFKQGLIYLELWMKGRNKNVFVPEPFLDSIIKQSLLFSTINKMSHVNSAQSLMLKSAGLAGTIATKQTADALVNVQPVASQLINCPHEYVNVGFSTIKMVCKHCNQEKS